MNSHSNISETEYQRWKVAGCIEPGSRHIRRGECCQDSVGWISAYDLLAIAVSDGAGSARHSQIGAITAVRASLSTVLHKHVFGSPLDIRAVKALLCSAFERAIESLYCESEVLDVPAYELACTLILVVVGRNFVASAHAGDGAVVLRHTKGELLTLSSPSNGEFANETRLLGFNYVDVDICILPGVRVENVAAFTDGMQRLALTMPASNPHEPLFDPLFNRMSDQTEDEAKYLLAEFLASPRVNARTDDDRTFVIAQAL